MLKGSPNPAARDRRERIEALGLVRGVRLREKQKSYAGFALFGGKAKGMRQTWNVGNCEAWKNVSGATVVGDNDDHNWRKVLPCQDYGRARR